MTSLHQLPTSALRGQVPLPKTEIEAALHALEGALQRDRSHVVLVADGATLAELPKRLAARLAPTLRTVAFRLARVPEDAVASLVLRALRRPPSEASEGPACTALRELDEDGGALVVVVADARKAPRSSLRRLGQLATDSGRGLRIVLPLDRTDAEEDDWASSLVQSLGVGVEKIVLGRETVRTLPLATSLPKRPPLGPPAIEGENAARARGRWPLPATRAAAAAAVVLAAGLALGVMLRDGDGTGGAEQEPAPPAYARVEPPSSEIAPSPRALPLAPPPVAAAGAAVADIGPEARRVETARREDPEPRGEQPPAAAAPAPPAVPVSFNAHPWARVWIDGREIGTTPLADVRVAPGTRKIRAHFPDGRVVERNVPIDQFRDRIQIR